MRLVSIMLFALLAGCGQKGPLYKADDRPESAQPIGGDRLDGAADNDNSSENDEDAK